MRYLVGFRNKLFINSFIRDGKHGYELALCISELEERVSVQNVVTDILVHYLVSFLMFVFGLLPESILRIIWRTIVYLGWAK